MKNDDEYIVNLIDLTFDFEDYFQRSANGTLTEEEQKEFNGRICGQFCRDFYKNGNASDVPNGIMKYMANQMFLVLAGEEWESAFPLPWTTPTPIRSRADEIALTIFCDIANLLRQDANIKTVKAIEVMADKHHVSFEKARAAWYNGKKWLDDDFLKNRGNI